MPESPYAMPISVRVPATTLRKLDAAAAKAGVSRSFVILRALEKSLGLNPAGPDKAKGSANADVFG